MKDLYVITHPQSRHHIERLVGGWYDSELTEFGQMQAARIGRRLRDLIPTDAEVEIHSSDLKRTFQTAEVIGQQLHAPVLSTTDLREKSFGEAGGKPQSWLDERIVFPPEMGNRLDHDEVIPGAETRRVFAERVYRAMDRIVASPCRHQIIVTHGGALTFVVAAWIKMPIEATGHISVYATSGGITHLREDDHFHNRGIVRLNDTAHLA